MTCPPITPPQSHPFVEGKAEIFKKEWYLFFYHLAKCLDAQEGGVEPGAGPDHWVRTIGKGNNTNLVVGVDVAPRLIVGCPNPADPKPMILTGVYYMLKFECTGQSVITNPKKNGATALFSLPNRPTVPVSDMTVKFQTNMAITNFVHTDYLTFDVDQVGNLTPGAGFVITFVFKVGV